MISSVPQTPRSSTCIGITTDHFYDFFEVLVLVIKTNEVFTLNIISKNDIYIVPHGNYTQFINIRKDKTKSRAKLDLPQDKTILLFFGMIKKVKGLEVLLKSMRKIIDKNPDVVLLIAGKPWENNFSIYQKIIDENNLRLKVLERGSGITLACGSGACAASATAILKGLVKTPVTVHMDGGDLIIDWDGLNSIIMSGPAEIVFEGEFDLSLIKEYG